MNYNDTIDYLYRQLPMFQRQGPKAFKKDLNNIIDLLEVLQNPHHLFDSIHIAGTNGKGTVSHMLSAIFQSAGYKTGLYTSPHYRDFRERIKINGKMIPKRSVVDFVERISQALDHISPSFFELSVAMAFDFFAAKEVDMAIVETGLGGRLDSTNVLNPKLCIITNISYDHQSFLGESQEEIAIEKAGIMKPNIPVLIGEKQDSLIQVFEQAAERCGAPLYFGQDLANVKRINDTEIEVAGLKEKDEEFIIKCGFTSPFLEKNTRTAIAAVKLWNDHYPECHITKNALKEGFVNLVSLTSYVGRWQILSKTPKIIADSAHNEAGLVKVLKELRGPGYGKIHFVLGFVYDKDWKKLIQMFPKNARYYFCKADIPRGLDARELRRYAENIGLKGKIYRSIRNALKAARRNCKSGETIFVGGSSFVVAEVV